MALEVGRKAPGFEVPSTTREPFRLADALAESPGGLVIAFFPLAFTGG